MLLLNSIYSSFVLTFWLQASYSETAVVPVAASVESAGVVSVTACVVRCLQPKGKDETAVDTI